MPPVKPHSPKNKLNMDTALSHLNLETIDETQTAFAMSGVGISERTAFRWREMARENSIPQLFWEGESPSIQPRTPDVKPSCFNQILRQCVRMLRRQPHTTT
jgi:hypothetical protein